MKKLWRGIGIMTFWVTWLGLFAYLYSTKRTRVILVSPDNHVLLVKGWLGSGKWILPGGGIHTGEDPRAGAVREIQEETGLHIKPSQLVSAGQGRAQEYGLRFSYETFVVHLKDMPDLKRQRMELTDVIWMPLNQLKDLSPVTKKLLADWIGKSDLVK